MVARTATLAFAGIDAIDIDVQVNISPGLPAFNIVGLADKAVAESRERIRAALYAIGLSLPAKRITVNLAPADFPKEGSHYDLAIALGILVAMEVITQGNVVQTIAMGELGLDGSLATVSGIFPAAVWASSRNATLICPDVCGPEAAWAGESLNIICASNLLALVEHLRGKIILPPPSIHAIKHMSPIWPDLKDVKGQTIAKRALEVTAAGGHNLLMIGSPGAGKSMLASRLPSILPPLDPQATLETTMIHSIAGKTSQGQLVTHAPYRAPHHSATLVGLVGGGSQAKPGEISLAHNGVLFLDELAEFSHAALEALRQPLEAGTITLTRANAHVTYPASFQWIAAMNPCRCGYLADVERACRKAPRCAETYQGRISGPLWDRIDIMVDVPEIKASELLNTSTGESSQTVAARVLRARIRQAQRYADLKLNIRTNAQLVGEALEQVVILNFDAEKLLHEALDKLKISARGYYRVLRVARTIADLDECDIINRQHIGEALGYRTLINAPTVKPQL